MPILSAREQLMISFDVFSEHDVTFLSVIVIGRISQNRRDVKPRVAAGRLTL